jgi:hypothetical protein
MAGMYPGMYPTGIDTSSIGESNKLLIEKVEAATKRLNDKIEKLQDVTKNSYFDLAYYFITVGIAFWFVYIILKDIYRTLKAYSVESDDFVKFKAKSTGDSQKYIDDNDYEIEEQSFNTDSYIKQSSQNSAMNMIKNLGNIIDFKQKNNINGGVFEYADETTNNIDPKYDDYDYPAKKNESSFWNVLLNKPKHYDMVNNNSDLYY